LAAFAAAFAAFFAAFLILFSSLSSLPVLALVPLESALALTLTFTFTFTLTLAEDGDIAAKEELPLKPHSIGSP
jgi:hypothetical protein